MAILMNLALAGLLLSPRDTQAKNIQTVLGATIAGDFTQESLLSETSQGFSTTLSVSISAFHKLPVSSNQISSLMMCQLMY